MSGPMTVEQQLESGMSHHRAGRLAEAERIYRQVLAHQPDNAEALHLLGVLSAQVGKSEAAVELIRRAISLNPDLADAHYNLGKALTGIGQLDQAIASYQQAIRLKPDNAVAYNNLGIALKDTGQFEKAVASYREAIRLKPDYPEARSNLGNALEGMGRLDEAIASYRYSIGLKPDFAEAHNNLGNALRNMGQLEAAVAMHRLAIRLNPGLAEAQMNLGIALASLGQLDEAIACYRQAIRLKPDLAPAYNDLGNAMKDVGRFDEAIGFYRQAIRLLPDYAVAHSNLVFILHYHPGYDGRMIHEELGRWNRQHAEPLKKLIQPHTNNRDPDRRLRLGYVSPDFRDHVVGRNLLPLLRQHDHRQMEIFCYSNDVRADALTDQLRGYADAWRSIVGLSDSRAVDLIRQDGIDILVDLALHMGNNRLVVFAHKPAPVQATFAGYPGSTGLETIDYRLTDPYLDPPGLNDQFYSETSIRLPDSFWCYEPLVTGLFVSPLPAQTDGHVTFGCLNNFCKVNEEVLQLWAQVLKSVPRSRFMLLCPEGSHRQPLLHLLQREGIGPDRIELIAHRPRLQYLELYHRIDVGLDSFPYNGHTTSLDSFWMGVPVVTLVGRTVVGRAGLSQLTNLGLPELIAQTPEQYVHIAAELAGELPRLAELRRTLRARMEASPLMDAPRFAGNIEAAYRRMWRNWCERGGASGIQCQAP
jgi:predicted O-linked N-acetylglucosamine transferase (SPINDLY family)